MGKFSFTKIETYEGCPFRYYLNYELGNYAYSDSIATEFGTLVHKTEETIAKTLQSNESIDYKSIKNSFLVEALKLEKKYPVDYLTDDGKSERNYRDKVYQYLNTGIYRLENFMKQHPTYRIVGIEQKFNFKYDEDHTFTGAIDRVFYDEETGNYLIQDIKTYAVPIKKEDLATPLQFVVYTLAAKELWNCTENNIKCQYDLPLVELTQDGGTNGYINRGLKKIEDLFKGISSKDFEPKQSPLCNWCSYCRTNPDAQEQYKNLCPYYSIWNRNTRNRGDINKHEFEWRGLDNHQIVLESFNKKYNII